jgi:hypothetical protein
LLELPPFSKLPLVLLLLLAHFLLVKVLTLLLQITLLPLRWLHALLKARLLTGCCC